MAEPLLELRNATKVYGRDSWLSKRPIVGLEDLSLVIQGDRPSITAIAGESGSGKSTLANAILGFVGLSSGSILFKGRDIASFRRRDRFEYRRHVQAVFQDPYETLNPFFRTRHVFGHLVRKFRLARAGDTRTLIEETLESVDLQANDVLDKRPHQLSGGQRQRVMIARLMLLRPELIVADEPVSMIDASLRITILNMMQRMRDEQGISFVYITHDLSTANRISDEMYVLYSGRIAEVGRTADVVGAPKHPYVQLLIESVPTLTRSAEWRKQIGLSETEHGSRDRTGCLYYPRCPHRMEHCRASAPPLYQVEEPGHRAACYLFRNG